MSQAHSTPPEVAEWLLPRATTPQKVLRRPTDNQAQRAQLEDRPGDPIAIALLTSERMENVWAVLGRWPGSLDLIKMCVHYANPALFDKLKEPVGRRLSLAVEADYIFTAADDLVTVLTMFHNKAEQLWDGPIDDLVSQLNQLAVNASRAVLAEMRLYGALPAPSARGRGDPHQILFRSGVANVLKVLGEQHGRNFTQAERDDIVANLASVVFPDSEVDAETVRRYRERQARRTDY